MRILKKFNTCYLSLPIWVRIPIAIIVFSLILISTQNLQVFPGALLSIFIPHSREAGSLPAGVESEFIKTSDGERLELWRLPISESRRVAVIFHGNGGDVEDFYPYQQYFNRIGITSYGFDYRGFGTSTGWPSEHGLYLDTKAVLQYVLKREGISPSEMIIVGISIGSGPASFAATQVKPAALLLFAPFTSLPDAIKSIPLLGYLHRFSIYEFPVQKYVQELSHTCLIIAHGEEDNIVPISQGRELFRSYTGSRFSSFLESPKASHNDILFRVHSELTEPIRRCFSEESE